MGNAICLQFYPIGGYMKKGKYHRTEVCTHDTCDDTFWGVFGKVFFWQNPDVDFFLQNMQKLSNKVQLGLQNKTRVPMAQ